jgi:PAS domain S-box-containing protein
MGDTGKRARETELLESEQRYRLLLERAPVGIAVHLDGRVVFTNPAGAALLGATRPEQIVGRAVTSIVHPDRLAEAMNRIRRLLAGEQGLYPVEDVYVKLDGSSVEVEVIAEAITYSGRPAVQVIVSDITARKRVERALAESESKYRTLFEAESDALFLIDNESGRILEANQAAASLYGFARDELSRMHNYDLSAEPEATNRATRRAQHQGDVITIPLRYHRRRDGLTFPVEITARFLQRGDRWVHVAAIRDISERQRIEEALRRSEEQFRLAFDNSAVGKALVSTEGRFLRVNAALQRMLGYSTSELIGKTFGEITHPDDRESSAALFRDVLAGALECVNFEKRYVRKDGSILWVLLSSSLLRDQQGQPLHSITHMQDITERKTAEQQRQALEQQLHHARTMEAIGLLAGGVAHDFNNLLTPILAGAELMLLDAGKDDPRRADYTQILQAAERARDLVSQLLTFARKQPIAARRVSMNDIVLGFERILRRTIREDVTLDLRLDATAGFVDADPRQLEQVLLNLAVNSQDAMPGGGLLVVATGRAEFPETKVVRGTTCVPGPYVFLAVSDTGVGMDPDTQARIFEPFFTSKEVRRGTGLGLSTVHGIVEKHGGYIEVESEPGRGTVFRVCLPRRAEAPRQAALSDRPPLPRGSETILVVDDDELVRETTSKLLKTFGYRVVVAPNANAALALRAEEMAQIDLLLADVVMPGMNGQDLYYNLREKRPDLKALLMSGHSLDALGQRGEHSSSPELLTKPFRGVELARKIREVLERPS